MSAEAPETYWRVAWGEAPETARHIDYPDQWDAVAYYNVLRTITVAAYDDSRDQDKRLELMEQQMSTQWNCRAVHDGKEHNVWLWRMMKREG